ncbi:ABC transporter permease [Bifidobacterium sp. ESL0769]|uniref:ABC transporter permease n=1 Tax=Bifidobacterium sp. ESL0769 TaxID=2983229 RepID=UPI0023F78188|nr:ABC transporter permease [Bifidobacterium sp. ESL0769]WEV68223.1 ABC transporter permease [Bifidobacterium sp. ESL0769]
MFTTFKAYLKAGVRNPSIVFWVLAFPLIMLVMFHLMFSDINDLIHVDPQSMAVAEDSNWSKTAGAEQVVKALAGEQDADGKSQAKGKTSKNDNEKLITIKQASGVADAKRMVADGKAKGYLYVDDSGALHMALADTTVNSGNQAVSMSVTALDYALQQYNETGRVVTAIAAKNHAVMANPQVRSSIGSSDGFLQHVSVTSVKPHRFARYYFSLLGMACLLGMTVSINLITLTQANLSALGVRASVSPLPKIKQAIATLMASWVLSFACMLIAFLAMRYVIGIGIAGREPAAVLAVAASTLMASALGLVIGAISKLSKRAKLSLSTVLTCFLSLFTGLYGTGAMALGDRLRQKAPVIAQLNPARQVSDLFYDLLYYDNYRPFYIGLAIMAATTVVFVLIVVAMLRRQRYEHL